MVNDNQCNIYFPKGVNSLIRTTVWKRQDELYKWDAMNNISNHENFVEV